ncbi:MAG: DUF397 domain-containing protein [Streptomyces sp.]|nr:DUF397 domain-containing protein [Streptomyces sp.]
MSTPPDLSYAKWAKSSYSGNGGGNCVEWAPNLAASGLVPVRDSKTPDGPALIFDAAAWSSFVTFAKACRI